MNTIELWMLITPIAGLAAGAGAAAFAGSTAMVAGAMVGLVIGAVLHPGISFAASALPRLADRLDKLLAIVFVLYVLASPFFAWWLACFAVPKLIKGVLTTDGG
jgi:hypothetical protein